MFRIIRPLHWTSRSCLVVRPRIGGAVTTVRFNSDLPDSSPDRSGILVKNQQPIPRAARLSTNAEEPGRNKEDAQDSKQTLRQKMVEAGATSLATILVLGAGFGLAAYAYHRFYKWLVVWKIENAFKPGDPVLLMAAIGKQVQPTSVLGGHLGDHDSQEDHWIPRAEQRKIDAIVDGSDRGHYHLIMGEKGTGKSSMLIDAMSKVDGEGISMLEAHSDLEIVRVRLGKALDFEFHEDYIGSYFSEKGPRESTALLDIERALNKLEKVAMKRRQKVGRPLVLIIGSVHLLRDNEDGRALLELLQQRAEQWAASSLATIVFNTDEYWVYERLKQLATRMEVLSVRDLPKIQAISALRKYRIKYFRERPDESTLKQVYEQVGGRLTYLNRVAKSDDMLRTCREIVDMEKTWFLNQCWILGAEMDDDVMDQQKFASAAMVLAKELVKMEEQQEIMHPEYGHKLPSLPLHEARYVMTRADFIRSYDELNLFTISSTAQVRADSVPMHTAFREICNEPGFDERLAATLQRINDIESLGRTRELVAKDLVLGGKYKISQVVDPKNKGKGMVQVELEMPPEEDESQDN